MQWFQNTTETLTPMQWWRHQMETFSRYWPSQMPVTRTFDIFFDLRINNRLNKQSRRWWFETRSRSLCRHCNGTVTSPIGERRRLSFPSYCVGVCQYHCCRCLNAIMPLRNQLQWYWQCRINGSFSSKRVGSTTCYIPVLQNDIQ